MTSHLREGAKQNQNKNQFVIDTKLKLSDVMKRLFDTFI